MANVSSSNGLEKRPKLRFPGFDEPWKATAFGDLVHEFSNRTKVEDEDVLLSAAIEGMFLNTELFGHQRGASNKGYKKIKYGTMVLSTQNLHLGNANVNQRFEHGMVSPAYKTYDISGCSIDLIAQWIKSDAAKRFFYNATTVGASVCRRNVEWDTLYEQSLFLPSLPEQEKIANLLTLLSNRIEKQRQLIIALKKYKRGLLSAVFSQNVSMFSTADFYAFSELAVRRSEKYDPKCNAHAACIELEHIEQETGRIIGSNCADYQNSIKTVCKPGDVMFGKLRPYLRKYAFVQKECVCSSEIWSLIPTDIVIPKYLFYLIQSEAFMKVANVSSGTKMPRAEWSTIAKSGYLIPSKDDQQATVDILETTDRIIASHVASYDRFIEYKKGLLQRLFI